MTIEQKLQKEENMWKMIHEISHEKRSKKLSKKA